MKSILSDENNIAEEENATREGNIHEQEKKISFFDLSLKRKN
jgi:hypothetical protein